jgi:hypothetical protein
MFPRFYKYHDFLAVVQIREQIQSLSQSTQLVLHQWQSRRLRVV